jgi:hypothetical protein
VSEGFLYVTGSHRQRLHRGEQTCRFDQGLATMERDFVQEKDALYLRKHLFHGVEIRRVGWHSRRVICILTLIYRLSDALCGVRL